MIDFSKEELNVEEIMKKIKEEVRLRKEAKKKDAITEKVEKKSRENLPHSESLPYFEIKDVYKISDFVEYDFKNFINYAYKAILKREPSSRELHDYLSWLQQGLTDKEQVLLDLRYSPEGIKKGVIIEGLHRHHVIKKYFKIPLLGKILNILYCIVTFPRIFRYIKRLEYTLIEECMDLENKVRTIDDIMNMFDIKLDGLSDSLEKKTDTGDLVKKFDFLKGNTDVLRADVDVLKGDANALIEDKNTLRRDTAVLRADVDVLKGNANALIEDRDTLRRDTDVLRADVDVLKGDAGVKEREIESIFLQIDEVNKEIRRNKLNVIDQERRLLLLLEEARKRLPEPISTEQINNMLREEDHIMDAMYVSFQDRFRGTREDIKERQRIYLPYIQRAIKNPENSNIVDLGCGRGEWLELLKENNYIARGIDLNSVIVKEASMSGLEVMEGDAIDYLRSLGNNTLSVVTGFHIVEHLSLKKLIKLLDESLRVLKPGGMIIFETPNPENLLTGSCNFYTDPTHNKPIPPLTLQFLVEARGFVRTKIIKLNKNQTQKLDNEFLQELLFGYQDYSIAGYKS